VTKPGSLSHRMEALATELQRLQRDVSLDRSLQDVDKILDQLCRARNEIAAGELEPPHSRIFRAIEADI
jgi:hypothetical protein